jgi:hypothetical protein
MLEHLRYATSAYAGGMIAGTLASPLCTALGVQTHSLVAMFGGTAAVAGLGALAGYFVERGLQSLLASHRKDSTSSSTPPPDPLELHLGNHVLTAGAALQSLPKIAYPSISGATPAEKAAILDTLNHLPLVHATSVDNIRVVDHLDNMGISGVAHPLFSQSRVVLNRSDMIAPPWNHELVTHETAHAVDYSTGLGPLGSQSSSGPFGHGPFVSDYAKTDWLEDWAESDVKYHQDAAALKQMSAEKYAAIDHAHHHPLDQLLDRPSVRHVGQQMGEAMGAVPGLRTGLQLAGSLIAPWQIHRGASMMERGLQTGDAVSSFRGRMNLASGLLLLFPGAAVGALGMNLLHYFLALNVQSGTMSAERADGIAARALAVASGPVGMISMVAGQELKNVGVDPEPALAPHKPVSGPSMLKGLLCTIGGIYGGAVAGASVGASLAGAAGGAMGMYWGMIGGATLGVSAYGLYLARKSTPDDDPLKLTRDDKKFLTRVLGGAVAGGAIGTVAGAVAGDLAGRALGTAVGGPVGGYVGSWIGRVGGVFAGSYGLAKVGAAAGRKLQGAGK